MAGPAFHVSVKRDHCAAVLASAHYGVEPGLTDIYRVLGDEEAPGEPVKLLEVNHLVSPAGIQPLGFGPAPQSRIWFPSVIIEVTPGEFSQIKEGTLKLPHGWTVGERIKRAVPYPQGYYDEDGDLLELIYSEENFFGEYVNSHLTLYRSESSGEVIGFALQFPLEWAKKVKSDE